MRFRIWLYASTAVALLVAVVVVARSEAGSLTLARMRSSLFQAAPPPAVNGAEEGERIAPAPGRGAEDPDADGSAGNALAGGELPPEGGAEWGLAAEEGAGEGPPVVSPAVEPYLLETPGRSAQQRALEEALRQVEILQARLEALEGSLAELEADRQSKAEQIAELEEELDSLNRRGQFLEENRAARIERLESGMEAIVQVDELLAQGQGDLDRDLGHIAQELAGAASDASRYAGEEEARLAAEAQAEVQAAREALGRSDLFNARIHLRRAMANARQARVAAEAGTQPLFP